MSAGEPMSVPWEIESDSNWRFGVVARAVLRATVATLSKPARPG